MAKGKTIKSITKRFKTTRKGKVIKVKDGQNHLNAKASGKKVRQKRNLINLSENSGRNIKKLISLS